MTDGNLNDSAISCFAQGTEGDMTQCVIDGAFAAGPAPGLTGLLLAGTLLTSLYVAGNGSVVFPAIITIILGAAMVPLLPPQFVSLAWSVLVAGTTAAVFGVIVRYTHQGGF